MSNKNGKKWRENMLLVYSTALYNTAYFANHHKGLTINPADNIIIGDSRVAMHNWYNKVNLGISGDYIEGAALRIESIANGHGSLTILVGVNNIVGLQETEIETINKFRFLLRSAKAKRAKVNILSIPPCSAVFGYLSVKVHLMNPALVDLCAEYGANYIDINSGLLDASGFLSPSLTTDGIHFTNQAYSIIESAITGR